jgi:hypothetical protein
MEQDQSYACDAAAPRAAMVVLLPVSQQLVQTPHANDV